MTVQTEQSEQRFAGDGVSTVFVFPHAFLSDGDLVVNLIDDATGVATLKTLGNDYSVAGAGDPSGGMVTMIIPPAAGTTVVVQRNVAALQNTKYVEGAQFPAQRFERDLDRAVMLAQQAMRRIDRALRQDDLEVALDMRLPPIIDRSGKFMGFSAIGEPVVLEGIEGGGTAISLADLAATATGTEGAALVGFRNGPTGVPRTTLERLKDAVHFRDFGPALDGLSDDSAALQAAMDTGRPVIMHDVGICLISAVTTTTATKLIGFGRSTKILLRDPVVPGTPGIVLNHAGSGVEKLFIDAGNTGRTAVQINADDCFADVIVQNVTAPLGAGAAGSGWWPSGIEVNNALRPKISIDASNFTNTGAANESLPRVVLVQGTTSDYLVETIVARNVQAGFVNGSATGKGHIDRVLIDGAIDNGIYNLGGDELTIDQVVYRGSEEAVVCLGKLTIGQVAMIGAQSGIGIQDCPSLNIDSIVLIEDSTGSPLFIFRTRAANVAAGKIRIGRIVGRFTGTTLFKADIGTIDHLSVSNMDVEYLWDAAIAPPASLTGWALMTSCKSFHMRDWNLKIVDKNNASLGNEIFWLTGPVANLAAKSIWHNITVEMLMADESTPAPMFFRAAEMAQSRINVRGARWQAAAIGPYIRDVSANEGQPDSVDGIPTLGTWRKGTDLNLAGAAAAPFRVRCTIAGTPGTWVGY